MSPSSIETVTALFILGKPTKVTYIHNYLSEKLLTKMYQVIKYKQDFDVLLNSLMYNQIKDLEHSGQGVSRRLLLLSSSTWGSVGKLVRYHSIKTYLF